jgi:uncharacterized small protein (DUF1192 family)
LQRLFCEICQNHYAHQIFPESGMRSFARGTICLIVSIPIRERTGMAREDDDRSVKAPKHEVGQDIALLSVFELHERVALLKAEIARLEAAANAKDAARNAAAAFFKS